MIEPMRTASGHPAAIPIPGATSRRRRPRPVFTLGRSSSRSSCNSGSSRSESSTISRTGSSGSSDMIFGPMEGLSQESPALGQTPHRHLYPVANMPSRVVSPEPVPCSRCGRLPGYHTESCEGTSTGLSRYNMSGGTMPLHSLHSTRLPAPRHRINPDESGHHDTGFGAMQSHEGLHLHRRPFPFCHSGPSTGHLPAGISSSTLPRTSFLVGSPPQSFPINHLHVAHAEAGTHRSRESEGRTPLVRETRSWATRPPRDRRSR